MSPALMEKMQEVRSQVQPSARMSLTDFARGKKWREELPERGVIEIMDRVDTAGWLVSVEYMSSLVATIDQLAYELEEAQIDEMIAARSNYNDWCSGEELALRSIEDLHARKDDIMAIINGD